MFELRSNIVTGLGIVVVGLALAAATASGAATVRIPVVRCATVFGVGGPPKHVPATISVSAAGPSRELAAYTNTELFLVGPRGLRCSGIVAADGGSQVIAWAPGRPKPAPHSHGVGLTLNIDPACAGCKADDACPFFTVLASMLGFPCSLGVPPKELVSRPRADLALFEDPPGVAGSGWPSGGPYPANGVVGVRGSPPASALVYRSTCTLPAAEHAICTASLNDVVARYG
ncbi:MAG TPA: hypothetical protein VN740_00890 [Solirubrobacteraceae bacterium]|nr:hypothetical protein [Solirubrobacteraceae bacterium]